MSQHGDVATGPGWELRCGDCLEALAEIEPDSMDACVSDPPYGLLFMGKTWDYGVPGREYWQAVFRVLKPGAPLLAFGGTRTYHRLTVAIEDAGFEIRDCLMWLYGSGFPKSLDVGKALDKRAGVEREVVGTRSVPDIRGDNYGMNSVGKQQGTVEHKVTSPASPMAKTWDGYGTSLKPSWEPIVLARKPLQGTVAANVEAWGVGGINVDGCRVGTEKRTPGYATKEKEIFNPSSYGMRGHTEVNIREGRWPANVLLDEEAGAILDSQTGVSKSKKAPRGKSGIWNQAQGEDLVGRGHDDTGGASRFFYCPKVSKKERAGAKHPTMKPQALMRYLVRLVAPPGGGIILDPFMGSGSTGIAAMAEGCRFIGVELEDDSFDAAVRRMQSKPKPSEQLDLFDPETPTNFDHAPPTARKQNGFQKSKLIKLDDPETQ